MLIALLALLIILSVSAIYFFIISFFPIYNYVYKLLQGYILNCWSALLYKQPISFLFCVFSNLYVFEVSISILEEYLSFK